MLLNKRAHGVLLAPVASSVPFHPSSAARTPRGKATSSPDRAHARTWKGSPMRTMKCVLVAALGAAVVSSAAANTQITVRFAPGAITLDRSRGGVIDWEEASVEDRDLEARLFQLGIVSVRPVTRGRSNTTATDRYGSEVELADLSNDFFLISEHELDSEDLDYLRGSALVRYAGITPSLKYFLTPDDTYLEDQWALNNVGQDLDLLGQGSCTTSVGTTDFDINAFQAWDSVTTPGTKVAIIDTGFDATHEDLGTPDSRSFSSGDRCKTKYHGTAVGAIIAAIGDNDVGIAGVINPTGGNEDDLVVMESISSDVTVGECPPDLALAAVQLDTLAAASGIFYPDVLSVNESFGTDFTPRWEYDPVMRDAHWNAYRMDLTVAVASGNFLFPEEGCSGLSRTMILDSCQVFPAGFSHLVIGVGGINSKGVSLFPNFDWIDVSAPSDVILTAFGGESDEYYGKSPNVGICGTSLAAPHVAGGVAMLLGANEDLTNDDIRQVFQRTAVDLGDSGYDTNFGHGLIKLDEAIKYVSAPREVHHGTTSTFAADSVTSRSQDFRQVRNVNATDTFDEFWVEVWEVEVTIDLSSESDSIVAAWPRPRISTGFPNENRIDGRLFGSDIELVSWDQDEMVLRTFTYKVFEDDTKNDCLGWHPIRPSGAPTCGQATGTARFDYTYVTMPHAAQVKQDGRSTTQFQLSVKSRVNGVELQVQGAVDDKSEVQFEAFDATGRRVWATQLPPGIHSTTWNQVDLPSGVYLVRARQGSQWTTRKIVVVR